MTFTIYEMFFIYCLGYVLGSVMMYLPYKAPWNRKEQDET
jgi:hypothetical protein